jgi:hypothetical protein
MRPRRALVLVLLAMLAAVPAAHASIAFRGFSKSEEKGLRSDLAKSMFPYASLLTVTVRPKDLPEGLLGLATSDHAVYLDPNAFEAPTIRTFAFLHELSHQIDFQLLPDSERSRYYEAAGFGPGTDVSAFTNPRWYDPGAEHGRIPAEQWASAVPLVVWPVSAGDPYVRDDGTCLGWEGGEGCAAPLAIVRDILDGVLAKHGLTPLGTVAPPVLESFVPPRLPAPATRSLRPPDPGVPPVPTQLAPVAGLSGVSGSRWNVLRVRLAGTAGPMAGATVVVDYKDATGWYELVTVTTSKDGEVVYRFRPTGWKPTAFRVTFAGAANLAGASVVVPVAYGR